MAANDVPCCESMFWVYLFICVGLVAFAGLMSGLTLGLMSLELVDLEVLIKAGQPEDSKNAAKILPLVKKQHLLLCTLLICNSLAMEALPIFLDALLPAWGAVLISVTLILAFGEIIPQAVCSRYGLSIGAKLSPLVRLLVIVVFPLSYPISKLLDSLLGKQHSALLRRAELKTLVDLHGNEAGKGGELTRDETTIISGALDLTEKTAKDAMTPLSRIFALDLNSKLDDNLMNLIISQGHSRVPVYSGTPSNIVGLILIKNLIKCRPEDETPIRNLTIRKIPRVYDSIPLYDMLNQFQKGQSHMAVVVKNKDLCSDAAETENAKSKVDMLRSHLHSINTQAVQEANDVPYGQRKSAHVLESSVPCCRIKVSSPVPSEKIKVNFQVEAIPSPDDEVIGIITMEDVLEELLQEPIYDETDEYVDVHNKIKINMIPAKKYFTRSPGGASALSPNTRSGMMTSPPSSDHQTSVSYNHSPLLRSPVSPYSLSPTERPNLYASPRNYTLNSPIRHAQNLQTGPSFNQVSTF
ncbi:OLC1v1027502C1 [Oldenlandia corymbosa var. corymbosa]|uniref:OLC1v1027502C1 n=1 Tax=Oldenlandia corymbosa var. corymbosa TaxID=529605 RepID=A0AAV1CBI2_OLDCO|nr:OLC1v1027502C1 [Oldenlandia corymbosa var. corymbosa]